MRATKCRGIAALIPVVLALGACGTSPIRTAAAPAGLVEEAGVPVTVQGFMPGYTDDGLAQSVSSCAAQVPVPEAIDDNPHSEWQLHVYVQNIYMPRSATEVRVSLLRAGHVVALRSQRKMALNASPQAALCGTVSGLTQQLWASVSMGGTVSNPPAKS